MVPQVPEVSPELPAPTWRLILSLIGRLPERALSRVFGRVADLRIPRASRRAVYGSFARAVGIDLAEVELPLEEYSTLNAFFVRRLREGTHRWPEDPTLIVSPVDGIIGRGGAIRGGTAIQAKGHDYAIAELLADEAEAERYEGGEYLTIYLSPRHYHRIHTPCPGAIPGALYIPGSLYPVNAAAVSHIPHLFARNERLVCHLDTVHGRIAVVAVGAYNVGRISAAFDSEWSGDPARPWVTNRHPPAALRRHYDPPRAVARRDEIMAFHLGSTVVLLFEAGVRLRADLASGDEVRVGDSLQATAPSR